MQISAKKKKIKFSGRQPVRPERRVLVFSDISTADNVVVVDRLRSLYLDSEEGTAIFCEKYCFGNIFLF